MEPEALPVNIYTSSTKGNLNPESIKAIQKGVQEVMEKFQGKGIIYLKIKNYHCHQVGKHRPPPHHHWENSPWSKFDHRKGKHHHGRHHHGWHHHGWQHGKHGHDRHHQWRNWFYHSAPEEQPCTVNIEEIEISNAVEANLDANKDKDNRSSGEWCLIEYGRGVESENKENEDDEHLRESFDNMNVTKSV